MRKGLVVLNMVFYMITAAILMIQVPYSIAKEEICPTLLNQMISDIFTKSEDRNRRNLDVEQTLKINGKCATPLIHYALKHRELLWPENRFILYRPDNPSFSRYYSPDRLLDLTYNTPEGHFKIHYTESVDNAVFNSDGDPSTIPDYVIQYGSYFEDSWDYETNILGYNPPHSDGTNGGDNRFDVYIMDITYYGYTSIENGHPYTVVDNDYSSCQTNFDPEGSRIGSMKVTAAHELFHAIQFFYDDWCDGCLWWEENTALWMEDEVFDYVDDYLRYLKDKLLNMELPMDDERYMSSKYGGVIWAKFLSETYGKDIIRDIFERLSTNNSPAKYAIEYTLLYDYYSNWGEAMTRFCLKNLTLDYEEGDKYLYYLNADTFPEIIHNQISTTDIEAGYLELGRNIGHLSCKYFKFVANTQIENIRAGLTSQGEVSPLALFVADENSTGNPIWDPNIWPSTGMEFVLDEFGPSGTYPRAYLIIINPDPDNDNCQYSLTTDINTPELQTPVIHYPVSGQVITSNYDYQPFKVTLSINNLPNDPLNPDRELEYVFELYKNNNSNLVDSQIIPEDHNNPNGTTSCQITLNDQTGAGGLYYWRCKARIVNSNDRSLWTPLSDFYVDSSKIQNPNNRHQYQLFDTEMTWIDAYAYCEILGGHLATITSQDEDDFVYSNLGIDGINIWLGGTDEETEGAWKWITGESWSYTNWGSTQPDNLQNGQNYLSYFDSEPGKWDDDGLPGYNNTHPFICEWSNYLITLTIPKIATEGNGIITEGGIVSVASVPDTDLVLNLSSNDPSVILLPATVTIYADQNSATFDINILDNCIFNDSQIMTITASAYGYISGSNTIQIADNDVLIEMNLLSGWSMISLPVISCNISVSSVFPEAKVVYGYEENLGYYLIKEDENIIIGKGYWILLDQNQKFSLTGQPIPSYNKTIHHEGWAMIGGCTSNARPITDNCNIGVIYKYVKGTGYQRVLESEDLESGQGYWILFKNVEDQASLTVHGEWPGEEPSSTEFISASPQTIALICARNNNLSPYNL